MASNYHPDIHQNADYLGSTSDWVEQAAADAWTCTRNAARTTNQFIGPAKRTAISFTSRAVDKVENCLAINLHIQPSKDVTGDSGKMVCKGIPLPAGRGNTICDANRGISWIKP